MTLPVSLSLAAMQRHSLRWTRRGMMASLLVLLVFGGGGCKKKSADGGEAVAPAKAPPVVRKKPRDADTATAAKPTAEAAVKEAPDAGQQAAAQAVAVAAPPTAVGAPAAAVVAAPAPPPPVAAEPVGGGPSAVRPAAGAESGRGAPAEPAPPTEAAAVRPTAERAPAAGAEPAPAVVAPTLPPPAPAAATANGEPALDITGYLSAADLERVLGPKVKLRRGDLAGTPASPSYNSVYFAPQKGDDFGIALQVWRDPNLAESRTRFNTMRNTYSDVAPTNKVAEQGFRAFFGGVVTLVFADARRPLTAAVSCSTKICTADHLIELSKRVAERLR